MPEINLRCPVCFKLVKTEVKDPTIYRDGYMPAACPTCDEKRRNELAAKLALQTPTDHLLGSTATLRELPTLSG
jgi:hypothetical protein